MTANDCRNHATLSRSLPKQKTPWQKLPHRPLSKQKRAPGDRGASGRPQHISDQLPHGGLARWALSNLQGRLRSSIYLPSLALSDHLQSALHLRTESLFPRCSGHQSRCTGSCLVCTCGQDPQPARPWNTGGYLRLQCPLAWMSFRKSPKGLHNKPISGHVGIWSLGLMQPRLVSKLPLYLRMTLNL